jgi:hypothetical protein
MLKDSHDQHAGKPQKLEDKREGTFSHTSPYSWMGGKAIAEPGHPGLGSSWSVKEVSALDEQLESLESHCWDDGCMHPVDFTGAMMALVFCNERDEVSNSRSDKVSVGKYGAVSSGSCYV